MWVVESKISSLSVRGMKRLLVVGSQPRVLMTEGCIVAVGSNDRVGDEVCVGLGVLVGAIVGVEVGARVGFWVGSEVALGWDVLVGASVGAAWLVQAGRLIMMNMHVVSVRNKV